MDAAVFERYLEEVEFLTDDQLDSLAFQVWVTQSERYAADQSADALTVEFAGGTITSYANIRGE